MIQLKVFTDQQNARKFRGEIVQAIAHVLKLMYGYEYHIDRLKHIKDIASWTNNIHESIENDNSSRGVMKTAAFFDKEFPFSKNKSKLLTILKKYDSNIVITRTDYLYANSTVFECINKSSKESIYEYLFRTFPKEGFDDWEVVKEGEIL